jgi:hypothetical protein
MEICSVFRLAPDDQLERFGNFQFHLAYVGSFRKVFHIIASFWTVSTFQTVFHPEILLLDQVRINILLFGIGGYTVIGRVSVDTEIDASGVLNSCDILLLNRFDI